MTKPKTQQELILPAGDLERVKIAFLYGADAVYVGLDKYSLRKAEVKFDKPGIKDAIKYAHSLGKRLFVTFNIFAHEANLKDIEKDMADIAKMKPDAFIIADPGVLNIAKRIAPKIPIHLSTQANTVNKESVRFWKEVGVKRIVLAREMTLEEIKEIHVAVPEMELEVFVHGAMCISYSGRCLLSNYLTGRSANLGVCAQPCRWEYKIAQSSELEAKSYYLQEPNRKGEFFKIEEDERGTYIMSSKDLKLIEHIDELIKAGVTGFKIEGRNKTKYYVATTARAYKKALELFANSKYGKKEKQELSAELDNLTRRGYTTGFVFGKALTGETYSSRSPIEGKKFLGFVKDGVEDLFEIEVKNKIEKGKTYELLTPTNIVGFKIDELYNRNKEPINATNPGRAEGEIAYIKTSKPIQTNTFIRE